MSVLQISKTLPDGRVTNFHAPTELHVDMTTFAMQIIVESFATEADARSGLMPMAKSVVTVALPSWSPAYANNLMNFVHADPAWSAATVIA